MELKRTYTYLAPRPAKRVLIVARGTALADHAKIIKVLELHCVKISPDMYKKCHESFRIQYERD